MVHEIGRPRHVLVKDLLEGYKLREPILGARGRILMHVGEILTQHHVGQLRKWEARPGAGRLSIYTRAVNVINTSASGRLRPRVEEDVYQSLAVQSWKAPVKNWVGNRGPCG